MTAIQAIIMAVLQGVTELFPISSLGHAVILPRLLNWNVDLRAPDWLAYLTVMHLGTAIALFIYLLAGLVQLRVSLLGLRGERSADDRRVFGLVVLATIPAVVIGAGAAQAACGGVRSALDRGGLPDRERLLAVLRRPRGGRNVGKLDQLNWKGALAVGFAQCLALIPGISRSGSTIVAGVIAGLRHEESARFSFLMGTPIILAANVYEAPKLLKEGATLGADGDPVRRRRRRRRLRSVWFLMRYFHKNEFEALSPFAYYCWAAGALFLAIILFA